uniref:DWNN domain-containing protein n=1 Tax=Oreochromis aureus TaxID=47969 RepID=A0AAZ1Y5N9_OREAU
MPHIHYKFSSRLNYDTVVFDGVHITLNELKRQIMGREKLRAGDCDLQITNAQTKEEYTDCGSLIPKGSSVIVRRIPSSSSKTHNNERSEVQLHHAFGASRANKRSSFLRDPAVHCKYFILKHYSAVLCVIQLKMVKSNFHLLQS